MKHKFMDKYQHLYFNGIKMNGNKNKQFNSYSN